jgi:hypothetical protein
MGLARSSPIGSPPVAPTFHPARRPTQAELPLDAAPAFEVDPPAADDFDH